MKPSPWQWLMQLAAADTGLPTQIFQNRHKTNEQHSSPSETVNIEPPSSSALSYILSQYVKNFPVRVSNRGDHSCCYGYSLKPLHIPNKISPPLKTTWILQLYIPICASEPSKADIAECVIFLCSTLCGVREGCDELCMIPARFVA
jgi:hypothetical protein